MKKFSKCHHPFYTIVLASTVPQKIKLKCFNTICRDLHFNTPFQLCTKQHVQPYLVQLKESGHDVFSFFFPDSKSFRNFGSQLNSLLKKILIDSLALFLLRRWGQLEKKKVAVHKINTRGTRETRQIAKRQIAYVYPKANIAGILGFCNYTREHVHPYLMHS